MLNVSGALAKAVDWVNLGELKETELTFDKSTEIGDDGKFFVAGLNFNAATDKLRENRCGKIVWLPKTYKIRTVLLESWG